MQFRAAARFGRFALVISASLTVSIQAFAQEPPKPTGKEPVPPKEKLLRAGTGPSREEAAIARGLAWLARQQRDDGSWQFDAPNATDQSYQVAATGLALLPFLAVGEGPTEAKKYQKTVSAGVGWLASWEGGFIAKNMYAQAIATIALCDAYALSKDDRLKGKATQAVNYIVKAQGKNGSWGYKAGMEGDTSITGWQIQALTAADIAGIRFERERVYKKATTFLDAVSTEGGALYGYREKGKSQTLTPVGLLSRFCMGDMTPNDPSYATGVKFLIDFPPDKRAFDMYYLYYATRVVYHRDGDEWRKVWSPKLWDLLTDKQDTSRDDAKHGSWDKDWGFIGAQCGRLGTTCLAILTLEVPYRYPSLKKAGGPEKLKK